MWVTRAEQNLNNYLRFLWMQNAYWMRIAVQSKLFNLPDTEIISERLMQNPKDFEMALRTFYGDDNASELSNLMLDQLTIATDLVNAMMNADAEAQADAERRWNDNVEKMASFLNSLNSNWAEADLQNMLQSNLDLLKQLVSDMMARNFEASNATFANIERQAMELADMLTQEIVRQFPQYFR